MKSYNEQIRNMSVYSEILDALKSKRDSYLSMCEYTESEDYKAEYTAQAECVERFIDLALMKIDPLKY